MEAPPIAYALTDDGVSIAYQSVGDGYPLVVMPASGLMQHKAPDPVGMRGGVPDRSGTIMQLGNEDELVEI